MTRLMRRLVVVAVLIGVAGGGVAAVAVPSGTKPPPDPRVAPQRDPSATGAVRMRLVPGTMRTELRRDDPDGGPGWAVRSFTSVRAGHSARTQQHCQQVVRVFRGRPGWIDGSNVFRPAGVDPYGQAPTLCDLSAPGPNRPAQIDARSVVSGIEGGAPRFGTTFVWGAGGAGTKRVELRVGSRRTTEPASARGAFLTFLDEPVRRSQLSVAFSYDGGTRHVVSLERGTVLPRAAGLTARPGPVRLVARAPDPSGGLPWGVGGLRSPDGGWCLSQPQRVVAERVGHVDFDLGTFAESYAPVTECHRRNDPTYEHHPLLTSFLLGGSDPESPGAAAIRARIIRRTLPGETIVYGTARSDVRSITITTPRDVRTLIPSSPAHVFMAVYDGGFPTGEIVTTAHFADGTSREVDRFDVGGI